jgi:hypothetical protein
MVYSMIEYTKLLTAFFENCNEKKSNKIKFNKSPRGLLTKCGGGLGDAWKNTLAVTEILALL